MNHYERAALLDVYRDRCRAWVVKHHIQSQYAIDDEVALVDLRHVGKHCGFGAEVFDAIDEEERERVERDNG